MVPHGEKKTREEKKKRYLLVYIVPYTVSLINEFDILYFMMAQIMCIL